MSILIGNPFIVNKKCCKGKISEIDRTDTVKQLFSIFKKLGIKTKQIKHEDIKKYEVCSKFWTRDIFVKIDNTIVLLPCNSSKDHGPIRKNEYKILKNVFKKHIVNDSPSSKLEGGDIIQDCDNILIGYNIRTNKKGIDFIREKFKNKKVFEIKHSALHLDCCLSILDEKVIIYSNKYIKSIPNEIKKEYTCIILEEILDKRVDTNLALNYVLVGRNIVTAYNKDFNDLYDFLRMMKYNIHFINDYRLYHEGGGIRCMTQWINYPKDQNIY